jgi:hypothetical protein
MISACGAVPRAVGRIGTRGTTLSSFTFVAPVVGISTNEVSVVAVPSTFIVVVCCSMYSCSDSSVSSMLVAFRYLAVSVV